MRKTILLLFLLLPFSAAANIIDSVRVVPEPQSIDYGLGHFHHKKGKPIKTSIDASMAPESYKLEINKGVRITAGDKAGLFYGYQTLRQIVGSDIEGEWKAQKVTITDAPRFEYRGFMIDVSRFFTPKDDLLQIIDVMSMLKLNKLHLHLDDDNGWRIEIKKYPKLTEVGSRRVDRGDQLYPERKNATADEPTVPTGYYTQDDIREIVKYATERNIEVIPEIEMPAHSNAALASYPELACPTVKDFIGVLPGAGGHHAEIIYCAGNDKVFEFLEGVLDEIMELFPSKYIHLGGDEAIKTHWKQCPLCQKRIKDEDLPDEEALQGWFMEKIAAYLHNRGKVALGWDEIVDTGIPDDAIVFGWRGYGQAAQKAITLGHKVVMTPAKTLYLIRYQGPQEFEPFTYFGNNTLKDVFNYEPLGDHYAEEHPHTIMGIQGTLWTEFCKDVKDVQYLIFPRLLAIAETGWTLPENKNWWNFLKGLDNFLPVLDGMGMVYAHSMYNIYHKITPNGNGGVDINLSTERPDVEIHSEINADTTHLRAYTTRDGKIMGDVLDLPIRHHLAFGRHVQYGGDASYALTNGVRGSSKATDSEWTLGHWQKHNLRFIVDLGSVKHISKVTFGCINNYGMAWHLPNVIRVEVSTDGENFKLIERDVFPLKDLFVEGSFTKDISIDMDEDARYVRCRLVSPGPCPEGHVREGREAKVYIDEVIIE